MQNTIDWVDKCKRRRWRLSPDTHTIARKLKTGSSQLHHEFTNFWTISKIIDRISLLSQSKCVCVSVLGFSLNFFGSQSKVCCCTVFLHKILIIYCVSECLSGWLVGNSHESSDQWINTRFATRKMRQKGNSLPFVYALYFVSVLNLSGWSRAHICILWLSSTSSFHRENRIDISRQIKGNWRTKYKYTLINAIYTHTYTDTFTSIRAKWITNPNTQIILTKHKKKISTKKG